jgi:hypothetical protein
MSTGANTINPDLKQSIYKAAIREGGNAEFDFLFDQLETEANANNVIKLLYGLGSSRDRTSIFRLLDETITKASDRIRTQDTNSVYRKL